MGEELGFLVIQPRTDTVLFAEDLLRADVEVRAVLAVAAATTAREHATDLGLRLVVMVRVVGLQDFAESARHHDLVDVEVDVGFDFAVVGLEGRNIRVFSKDLLLMELLHLVISLARRMMIVLNKLLLLLLILMMITILLKSAIILS